ncbi:glycerophosphodiester phosphodiesterase family protein [Phaeovulum sp.]|uniref:glycerophosphodiester phosphodiesterase family protein n=1 Tax=Phaeovulum sp. TaxID=2934796 RepID=UPI00272FF0A6|nr:glycerophosphodiester phosphodiesterase family protein [Phaeovulum sp.]MDP1669223.1 glycerophosphodiester phosphodiesterase family protein [Phaeovulum sp.]MDZ4120513.1 glycerophosphodiester phosphodiesterase family protein [Phaeovulum sp.]
MMPALHPDFLRIPLAHRAFHDATAGRPENSIEAVRAALSEGYGIEMDIQPSADGVPMVFHDYDLERLTGMPGNITGLSADALGRLPLLGGREAVPTLARVLAEVAGRVPLLIEIKDQSGASGPEVGALERAVADALRGYAGPVAVMSFNPHSVAAFHAAAPDVAVGLTTAAYLPEDYPELLGAVCDHLRDIRDYERVGASFISHEAADLARPRVADLKARGAAVLCWTIRSPEAEAAARKIAHNITFEGYAASRHA